MRYPPSGSSRQGKSLHDTSPCGLRTAILDCLFVGERGDPIGMVSPFDPQPLSNRAYDPNHNSRLFHSRVDDQAEIYKLDDVSTSATSIHTVRITYLRVRFFTSVLSHKDSERKGPSASSHYAAVPLGYLWTTTKTTE